jgi:hypothetical protein
VLETVVSILLFLPVPVFIVVLVFIFVIDLVDDTAWDNTAGLVGGKVDDFAVADFPNFDVTLSSVSVVTTGISVAAAVIFKL